MNQIIFLPHYFIGYVLILFSHIRYLFQVSPSLEIFFTKALHLLLSQTRHMPCPSPPPRFDYLDNIILYDIMQMCISCQTSVILLSHKHNYIDRLYSYLFFTGL